MPVSPNALMRGKAREVLKPIYPTALLVALIASVPSLAAQVVAALSGVLSLPALLVQQINNSSGTIDPQVLNTLLAEYAAPLRTTLLVFVLSLLLSPVLNLGELHFSLKLLRGESVQVTDVFARMRIWWKAIALGFLKLLYIILWELPGAALSVLSTVLMVTTRSTGWAVLFYPGSMLMLWLGIRAALRITLATYLMADDPSLGPIRALRESLRLMKAQSARLLSLMFSFIGWHLLLYFGESIVSAMLGSVISSTLSMFFQLMIDVYMTVTIAVFYLVRIKEDQPQPEIVVE